MENLDKLPPQAVEMEAVVLGAMLLDRDAADVAVGMLSPQDFYRGRHKTIFETAAALAAQGALDQQLLRQKLSEDGRLDEVGGVAYLADLMAAVATSAHIEHYCRSVREASRKRQAIALATDILRDGFREETRADELAARMEFAAARMDESAGNDDDGALTAAEAVERVVAGIDGSLSDALPTGYDLLDNLTGGILPGNLVLIGGLSGTGKTAFACCLARQWSATGVPVAFFSYEMSAVSLMRRMAAAHTDIGINKRGEVNPPKYRERFRQGCADIGKWPLRLHHCALSLGELLRGIRRSHARNGTRVFIVDYLQQVACDGNAAADTREQEVAAVSRALRRLAGQLGIFVVAAVQLNDLEPKRRPTYRNIRESRAVYHDADQVWLLWDAKRDKDMDEFTRREWATKREIMLIVDKNREGEIGEQPFMFDTFHQRLDESLSGAPPLPPDPDGDQE